MNYVIVHAVGVDCQYAITPDYGEALRIYAKWLGSYARTSGDAFARFHLDWIGWIGQESRGRVVEYRTHRHGAGCAPEQVFVLGVLTWPSLWRLPPETVSRDWGRTVHHADHPQGRFELRTDGETWRIFWLDNRSVLAFSVTGGCHIAAEAAVRLAFIEAYLAQSSALDEDQEARIFDGGKPVSP